MMICIGSLDWANIVEGVPTLKQHLSCLGGVSVGRVNMFAYPAQRVENKTVQLPVNEVKLEILMFNATPSASLRRQQTSTILLVFAQEILYAQFKKNMYHYI